ncbi:MAG: alpha/beta hydrolase [Pseudomonadota bacterium]
MRILSSLFAASLAVISVNDEAAAEPSQATCEVGVYGDSQNFVVITKSYDEGLRFSYSDGRVGLLTTGGPISCDGNKLIIDGDTVLLRKDIAVTNTVFFSGKTRLAGQLLEPKGAGPDTPLVIYAHGSEELGWIEHSRDPYQMVGRGVSVFVYDKRGTGRSKGVYSQNFPDLAADLVAASQEARRLAAGRYGRIGLFGLSQGGWIAPMAADRADADFIGIGYGLVVDILEEDASQVELELRQAGYGEEIIRKAKEVTDVTARLATSGYRDGLEELDRLRQDYGDEPWFSKIRGGFTGVILGIETEELRKNGIPMFDRLNIDWSIKPMEVVRSTNVSQLWILAREDREAPIAKTLDRLNTIRAEGKDITLFTYPDTDHGMWEYVEAADGSRETTKVTSGFYNLMADWAKGDVSNKDRYGNAVQE